MERRTAGDVVHVEGAPGVVTVVAAWMLDPVACVGMEIGEPRVTPAALADLHHLLLALGFRTDSPHDSNVVREDQNEAIKRGAAAGHTSIGDSARLGEAAGDLPRRAQRGDRIVGQPADAGGGCRNTGER